VWASSSAILAIKLKFFGGKLKRKLKKFGGASLIGFLDYQIELICGEMVEIRRAASRGFLGHQFDLNW